MVVGEQCDDGNLNSYDGCSSICEREVTGLIIGGSIVAGAAAIALVVAAVLVAKGSAAGGAAGSQAANLHSNENMVLNGQM